MIVPFHYIDRKFRRTLVISPDILLVPGRLIQVLNDLHILFL